MNDDLENEIKNSIINILSKLLAVPTTPYGSIKLLNAYSLL